MKRALLLVLLLLGLLAVTVVRAQEGEEESESSEASDSSSESEAPAKPEHKASDAALPVEALTPLPVEPLSMDAAALKDDDHLFDMIPKTLSGAENVAALTESLKRADSLLQKMKRDVEAEKVWTKNVYDIIQNYQYKYLKTVKDVKEREHKVQKMAQLVAMLKQSTLHSAVEKELSKASKALSELVTRSGPNGALYAQITARMAKLKTALKTMPRPRELYSETTNKMKHILQSHLPPKTSDAVRHLANGHAEEEEEEEHEAPVLKAAPKKHAAPKRAAPKPAAKKAAPKPVAKKAAPKPVAKKAAPKPAPKKAAAEEEDS